MYSDYMMLTQITGPTDYKQIDQLNYNFQMQDENDKKKKKNKPKYTNLHCVCHWKYVTARVLLYIPYPSSVMEIMWPRWLCHNVKRINYPV